MADDIKATIRQILLETVMFDTYGRTEDGDFVPIRWDDSPLLDTAVDQIVQAAENRGTPDITRRLMDELAEDGRPVGHMQCNRCGYVEAYHPTDITAEEFQKEGKTTIIRMKEHFKEQGWVTSWGYDLCPDCAKGKRTRE